MKLKDERGGKLVVVAHCILNQNARVLSLADYPAVIDEVVDVFRKHDIGLVQLPCPELTYAGAQRPTKTKEEYDTPKYRKHCRQIVLSVAKQLEEFAENNVRIVALLGVEGSPSCGIGDSADKTGILIEALASELEKRRLKVPMHAINPSRIADDVKWLRNILKQL